MRPMLWSIVMKRELSQNARLSLYWSIFVPALIYGHEIIDWEDEITDTRAEMSFLWRVAELSLRDKVRSSYLESLGSCCSSSLKGVNWCGSDIWLGCFPVASFWFFWARQTRRTPRGKHTTHWRDYISLLAWEHLGNSHEELESVNEERSVWVFFLDLLSLWPDLVSRKKWVDEWIKIQMATIER